MIMEGYGGRAGSFQFDERVIDGIDTDSYYKRMESEANDQGELPEMG